MAVTLLSVLAAVFLPQRGPDTDAPQPVNRFSVPVPDLVGGAISPDGRQIAYVVGEDEEGSVWIRDLDRETPQKLEGTQGAQGEFWSPDSQFIGFATDRELKRIAVDGGDPITLCKLAGSGFAFLGGSWSPQGDRIVFSSGLELFEVPARGGAPELLVGREEVAGSKSRLWFAEPIFLPLDAGSQGLVYSFGVSTRDARLGVLDLETGQRRELGTGAVPAYSASGHLVYQTGLVGESGLWALPFSLKTLTPSGEAFRVVEAGETPTVAQDGTLVYFDSAGGGRILLWRDREGKKLGTIGQVHENIRHLALSPDGNSVAVETEEADGNRDIWVHDAVRGATTRLTFDPATDGHPAWAPSGQQITFYSERGGSDGIYSKPADGSGEAVLLVGEDAVVMAPDWSRDGKFLIYWTSRSEDTGSDLWYLKPKAGGEGYEPTPYLRTAANERIPVFSPDGRYVAYVSSESGLSEIYVRPFPEGGGRWQISINGGTQPRWRRDGKELFYVGGDQLMAVSVSTAQGFSRGTPKPLFRDRWLRSSFPKQRYDVSPDGQRFVLRGEVEGASDKPPAIRVVQNWYEEFRDLEQD